MKVVDEELKWLNEVIETQALELQHEKKPDGWFSISSISKVLYIPFPKHMPLDIKDSKLNKTIHNFEYLENGEDGYDWEKR